MKGDFDAVKRQYLTARKALENARGTQAITQLQKAYDAAKVNFENHPGHPRNANKPEPEKRL